jgi:hypothetical protein
MVAVPLLYYPFLPYWYELGKDLLGKDLDPYIKHGCISKITNLTMSTDTLMTA